MWFPNRSDTNRPVQLQKQAKSLKFCSLVEEELYHPSSENKGADQLRGYREADLRLCFRQCRLLVFPWGGSYVNQNILTLGDCLPLSRGYTRVFWTLSLNSNKSKISFFRFCICGV